MKKKTISPERWIIRLHCLINLADLKNKIKKVCIMESNIEKQGIHTLQATIAAARCSYLIFHSISTFWGGSLCLDVRYFRTLYNCEYFRYSNFGNDCVEVVKEQLWWMLIVCGGLAEGCWKVAVEWIRIYKTRPVAALLRLQSHIILQPTTSVSALRLLRCHST